jgi:hypothetical protein
MQTSRLFTVLADGSLMASLTRQAGAFIGSKGVTLNPDGSLYVSQTTGAAKKTTTGLTFNVDGAMLVNQSKKAGMYVTSDGFSINPNNGAVYISLTRQPGAHVNTFQLTCNPDGALFTTLI